jgi:hypothetical protein
MTALGNFLFLSLAMSFGMMLYTLFLVVLYHLFLRERSDETHEITPDEVTIDERTADMEEVKIDV